jgi:hypothetical protein
MGPVAMGAQASRTAQAGGLPWCSTGVLRATLGEQTGGAGSVFTTLVFRNTGRGSCAMQGHPGVSLVDSAGRPIGRPATWVVGPTPLIVLRPGGTASTMIRTLNPGVGTTKCLPPSAALRVYPPSQRTSLLVPARLSECLGELEVRPLVAGSAGI